ncbi:hypothetical protein [Photobacterium kishitanii]|uniref:Uncharacterized protein n=1 Tax=Photobacterium kishitanii TaxID=318456 RepID=A0A2T3KM34_9GAMM|nr:hypothetical protein [Photobacterium kishitanii]PSV00867.1 hypothetical protein C9J27_02240 [Photobacterium kishitanii]
MNLNNIKNVSGDKMPPIVEAEYDISHLITNNNIYWFPRLIKDLQNPVFTKHESMKNIREITHYNDHNFWCEELANACFKGKLYIVKYLWIGNLEDSFSTFDAFIAAQLEKPEEFIHRGIIFVKEGENPEDIINNWSLLQIEKNKKVSEICRNIPDADFENPDINKKIEQIFKEQSESRVIM